MIVVQLPGAGNCVAYANNNLRVRGDLSLERRLPSAPSDGRESQDAGVGTALRNACLLRIAHRRAYVSRCAVAMRSRSTAGSRSS
jgi:hypothetical protein